MIQLSARPSADAGLLEWPTMVDADGSWRLSGPVGWLERWDATNQAQAEHDRDRYGGDDWVDRLNDDRPLPASHVAQQAVIAVALAIAAVVAVIVVLVRVIGAAG